jgi:cell volume regulation protein A
MSEVLDFGMIVLIVAGGFWIALLASKLTERVRIPGPALFLIAAAIASDVFDGVAKSVSIHQVERIGTVALVIILFAGGMHVGAERFKASALPIASLGVLGTFATAAVIAAAAHLLLDFGWTSAGLVGAALAPTDPAVMFSVLGRREVAGRSGTILEGESGANDPVGIALMIGMLDFATHAHSSGWIVVREFSVEMAVGLGIGLAGAAVVLPLMRRLRLPSELYPLQALAFAGALYGAATVAHGSGFLAVFVAGLALGDERFPFKAETEHFHTALASLAEIVVFVALGLTIQLGAIGDHGAWVDGLILFAVLAFVARPLVAGVLLLPVRLSAGERVFVMWGGLKGAVPIFLAALAVLRGVESADRIYALVFVVVALSVLVQGTSIPFVAPRLGVPMRLREPEPWEAEPT